MVFEKIRQALAAQFDIDIDTITEDTDVMNDLGADSLDLVELIMELESEYNVTLTDDSIYQCKTVGDITVYIENLID